MNKIDSNTYKHKGYLIIRQSCTWRPNRYGIWSKNAPDDAKPMLYAKTLDEAKAMIDRDNNSEILNAECATLIAEWEKQGVQHGV
jgi:hypothetical protein